MVWLGVSTVLGYWVVFAVLDQGSRTSFMAREAPSGSQVVVANTVCATVSALGQLRRRALKSAESQTSPPALPRLAQPGRGPCQALEAEGQLPRC